MEQKTAFFHLPGLFEFAEFYEAFLPVFFENPDWFYENYKIASIYGSPADCLWGGGRCGFGKNDRETEKKTLELCRKYGISARLTFSNSLLEEKHFSDKKCNRLCRIFSSMGKVGNAFDAKNASDAEHAIDAEHAFDAKNAFSAGIILHSDKLLQYLKKNYPGFYFVSSTTKVLTDFEDFRAELDNPDFSYVVPDFRHNKSFENLKTLTKRQKEKVEFLCNECCDPNCIQRKKCYENVSKKNLGLPASDHKCASSGSQNGYVFSKAMENPLFIGAKDIPKYLEMGFSNFKIEGRSLGSALILEFLLHYLTKPEFHLKVREKIYLDNNLDLF